MSHKNVQVIPLESTAAENIASVNAYLEQASDLNPEPFTFLTSAVFEK